MGIPQEQLEAMTLPQLRALSAAILIGVKAAEVNEKQGLGADISLAVDDDGVSLVVTTGAL